MDFVQGLGDTSGIKEIPVDDIGRVEILRERVRVTLITYRSDGLVYPPACLIWTVQAWKAARRHHELMHEIICGNTPDPEIINIMAADKHH